MTVLTCSAVLFDCDGVLVDSARIIDESWTRWALEVGVEPAAVLRALHGRRSQDTVALFVEDLVERAEALALIDAIELEDAAGTGAIPGARELLASIPEDRWAVFTSGSVPLATARLTAAGIQIPKVFITGDRVTHGKPHPEGYLAAARGLGFAPGECVVVEDAAPGIRAGREAGVRYVVGVGSHGFGDEVPDAVVADLSEMSWNGAGLSVAVGN
ncbi:MAG: HAD-IA family hydrolase [Propionibacteriaceae bacterium]|nr:HAD-IA family hydrolase [Propionibacteriaceae bacterium]